MGKNAEQKPPKQKPKSHKYAVKLINGCYANKSKPDSCSLLQKEITGKPTVYQEAALALHKLGRVAAEQQEEEKVKTNWIKKTRRMIKQKKILLYTKLKNKETNEPLGDIFEGKFIYRASRPAPAYCTPTNSMSMSRLFFPLGKDKVGLFDRNTEETVVRRAGKIAIDETTMTTLQSLDNFKPHRDSGGGQNGAECAFSAKFGFRKEPKGIDIAEYVFLANADKQLSQEVNNTLAKLCGDLEERAKLSIPLNDAMFNRLAQKEHDIPAFSGNEGGMGTQFSVGRAYHGKARREKAWFWTVLSVCCPGAGEDDILYYLFFPEYGINVPLYNGDVVVLNPWVLHSCSDPLNKDCLILSLYSSEQTFHARVRSSLKSL